MVSADLNSVFHFLMHCNIHYPGKVAVLKGDLEAKLPGWEIIVAPNEAVQLVKFLKDMKANGEI